MSTCSMVLPTVVAVGRFKTKRLTHVKRYQNAATVPRKTRKIILHIINEKKT